MAKILLVTHIFPPAVDGGSKIVYKIGETLHHFGHQIQALSSDANSTDDFAKFSYQPIKNNSDLFPIYRLPVATIFHRPLKKISSTFAKGPIFKPIPFIKALVNIARFHPDYIIAGPLPTTIIIYAAIIKKITGAKLITVPCYHPNDPDFNNWLIKKTLNQSDLIISFTKNEKKLLSQFCAPPIIVSPPGIDKNFLIDSQKIKFPQTPNILFIANFSAHKRFELLLNALVLLQKEYPSLTLTALGQKTLYWPKIQSLINPLGNKIKFVFNPTQKQVKAAIDKSTLLCLPSVHESFGLVFAESLARGKPVIGANTPQTTEVLKLLQGGITFHTDDVIDLVTKISSILDHTQIAQQLGQDGYEFIKKHLTWDTIVSELWQEIQ